MLFIACVIHVDCIIRVLLCVVLLVHCHDWHLLFILFVFYRMIVELTGGAVIGVHDTIRVCLSFM